MHIPKWLIATTGILFVALIAALAFFLGRESSSPPAQSTAVAVAPPDSSSAGAASAAAEAAPAAMTSPIAASPTPTAASDVPFTGSSPSPAAPVAAVDASQVNADARARVLDYFRQMDALQSGGPGGDPGEFANTIMQGATSGDFSGLDDLVRAAGDAERRAVALQPPAECAEYHRMAVALLQDSRTMMTTLRDGLKRSDADALTSLAASAQNIKARADMLASAEKALRARFGL